LRQEVRPGEALLELDEAISLDVLDAKPLGMATSGRRGQPAM
jgi:hypothetical protein